MTALDGVGRLSRKRTEDHAPDLSGRATAPRVSVDVHDDLDAVAGLWNDFETTARRTVFQTLAWCRTWVATVGVATGVSPAVAVARDADGQIVLIAPLGLKRHGGVREIVCLGEREADYQAPLVAGDFWDRFDEAGARDVMQCLLDAMPRHDLVSLERVPETVGGVRNPFLLLDATPYYEDAFWASLEGEHEDFIRERCGSKTLQTLRRKRRKLAAGGEVTFVVPTDRRSRSDVLDALFTQKSAQYRRTGATDVLALPGRLEFYRALALDGEDAGMSHLSALKVGDEIVSAHWGLTDGGRFHYLLASYAEGDGSRHSPGEHLLIELLAWCFDRGFGAFDFTNGTFGYKDRWSQHRLRLFGVLAPRTWRGTLTRQARIGARRAKTAARNSPVLWKAVATARGRGWLK